MIGSIAKLIMLMTGFFYIFVPIAVLLGAGIVIGSVQSIVRAKEKNIPPKEKGLRVAGVCVWVLLAATLSSPWWFIPLVK